MENPKLSRRRIVTAFAVAILADAVQFPATVAAATGIFALPSEYADLTVNCIAMALTSALIGFHWLLLPTMFIEAVPGLDLLPTWTGLRGAGGAAAAKGVTGGHAGDRRVNGEAIEANVLYRGDPEM